MSTQTSLAPSPTPTTHPSRTPSRSGKLQTITPEQLPASLDLGITLGLQTLRLGEGMEFRRSASPGHVGGFGSHLSAFNSEDSGVLLHGQGQAQQLEMGEGQQQRPGAKRQLSIQSLAGRHGEGGRMSKGLWLTGYINSDDSDMSYETSPATYTAPSSEAGERMDVEQEYGSDDEDKENMIE
ncbi:hypothetical protein SAICODRAFT_5580 [Saitoella complicata NRRL Y-17804]|uniref:uncharacterized protein n=1 Tax=Saitoella complicata (strain BCRC 22490 / CBS 7301 / JCM 7358 / NBRC 10748 / NRRL Y-17804) TaxID=698492 RepID=UPI00086729D6|nr:uncharacterized protein SAICODRAFT_5580 [Saitoella complicata NRRL Y-17804]ODQ54959.1 hypothetical protein SAICODRAFT_5580 [Saitoella complicata NRRL Y-17804]